MYFEKTAKKFTGMTKFRFLFEKICLYVWSLEQEYVSTLKEKKHLFPESESEGTAKKDKRHW